jgi:oligo-1,6-glucosidase
LKYVSPEREELSCIFDFDVVSLGRHGDNIKKHYTYKYVLPDFKAAFQKVQDLIQYSDAWGTVFLENHDQPRSVSRFATDEAKYRDKAAKLLAVLLSTLSGTLFLYQGQEIGTYNFSENWGIEEIKDIDSLISYQEIKDLHNADSKWLRKAMRGIQMIGRDNARLPVQWDDCANAGFTTGQPWIRVHDDYKNVNIARQQEEANSPLKFWQKMLKLRNQYRDLTTFGHFNIHDMPDVDTFTYWKSNGNGREMLVVLNFTEEEQPWDVPPHMKGEESELVIANVDEVGKYLSPWEGRVYVTTSSQNTRV